MATSSPLFRAFLAVCALAAIVAAGLNDAVSFVNQHFYDPLEAARTFALLYLMNPIRDAMQALPWPEVIAAVAAIRGWLGGWRTGVTVTLFVVVTGYWSAAMGSVYLTVLSVVISLAIGFPFGIWVAAKPRAQAVVQVGLDTLQTLPTLVYLLPAALPTLLLGVNRTVMMALSMLVIAALVGTRELGQEMFTALSQGLAGPGIVAGLAVACVALIIDTLLKAAALCATNAQGEAHV